MKKKVQLKHVIDRVAAGLSFNQIAEVIRNDREDLDAATNISSVSHGEVSSVARIRRAVGLQSLSEVMKAHWVEDVTGLGCYENRVTLKPTEVTSQTCPRG